MCGCDCGCTPRQFISKEEKIKALNDYKDSLEKEVNGVEERIKELKKAN